MPFFQKLNEFNAQKQREDLASRQAVETGLNKNKTSAMPSTAPSSAPTASVQQAPRVNSEPAQTTPSPSVMQQAQVNGPALQRMTWKNTGIVPMAGQGAYRDEALRDMNEADFAKHQGQMNASDLEYWTQQFKAHPESAYAYANMMHASNETPEQKLKRERREQLGEVFNNLGNLIGNAANLYYTHRGGQYIDLNTANERHRARMDRLKEKQDALDEQRRKIIINAKLGDIQAARAEAAKKEEREYNTKVAADKAKADQKLAELKYLQEMGVLTAKQAGELAKIKTQAEYDAKIAGIKNDLAIRLKGAPSYSDNKIVESMTDKDGNTYTRNSKLTDSEKAQIASMLPMEALEAFTSKTYDKDGNETGQRVDYEGAAAWAINQGYITPGVAKQIGFKKSKSSKKKGDLLPGNSKSISLLPK